jgi:hypothetical protein
MALAAGFALRIAVTPCAIEAITVKVTAGYQRMSLNEVGQ